ncbi:SpoIIE family protein phosphatase, partial [Streptomyces aurantiacus]
GAESESGSGSESGARVPPVRRVPLDPDETLLLVTDGVTEARGAGGAFFPLHEHVARAVLADPALTQPRRLVELVREGTLRHSTDRLGDDTTIFAVRPVRPART